MEKSPYTFNKLEGGNIEVLQNGQRISTGTESSAKSYGYGQPAPAPTTPTPTANTATPTNQVVTDPTANMTDTEKSAYNFSTSFNEPETEDQIFARKQTQAQGEIDALNKYYDTLRQETAESNEARNRGTNALSVMSGLSGSTEAYGAQDKTNQLNTRDLAKVENERMVAVTSVLSQIKTDAISEARSQRDEARLGAEAVLGQRKERQTNALNSLITLSQSAGATLEGLKGTLSPDEYSYIVNNVGGEAMAKAILFENRPKTSLVGSPTVVGGHMVQYYQTPDGRIVAENVELPQGVTPDNIQSIQKTDKGLFIINKDGTWNRIAGSQDNPPKTTITEKKTEVIQNYSNAFAPGVKMDDGTPTLDSNGFATPVAWKEAIKDAPNLGLTRADFIKQFGYLLYTEDGKTAQNYGLTPVETRLVVGTLPESEDDDLSW